MPYRCRECRKHFSVQTETFLAKGKLPLDKWLLAISMLTESEENISGTQMAEKLDVTPKTAQFLIKRIKDACPDFIGDQSEKAAGGGKKNKRAKKILLAVLCMSDDDWGDKPPQNKKNSAPKDKQSKAATRRDSVRGHRKTDKTT